MKRQTKYWLDSSEDDLTDLGLLPGGKPSREMAEKFFGMATEIHNAIKAYLSD